MRDPYLILGLDADDADDAAVEAAYHAGLRRCPPEHDRAGFEALRAAYEALRTRRDRVALALFDVEPPGAEDILDQATPRVARQRPDAALFTALLRGEA